MFNLGEDPVALLNDETHPPVEGVLAITILADGVLSSLHRITLFHNRKLLPGGLTILPLDTHLPALCGALVLHLAVPIHELLVSVGVDSQAAPVPYHRVEQHASVAVIVTYVVQ